MFKGASSFSLFIEQQVIKNRVSHLDAVLEYCKENFLDPEDIKHLINKSLRDKLEVDLINENLLPKRATLEIGE
jgi:hypothetical protein